MLNIITLKNNEIHSMMNHHEFLKQVYLDNIDLYQRTRDELVKFLKIINKLENEQYIDNFSPLIHKIEINGVKCQIYGLWWLGMNNKLFKGKYAIFYK